MLQNDKLYNTTSFGSRVADGIYETLLDGIELEELREEEEIDVKHYLMIDAHDTWWGLLYQDQGKQRKQQGKSYLCRIIDMLHMGYIDEVLFGYEVLEVLPTLVKEWLEIEKNRTDRLPPLTPETFTPTEKTTKSTRRIIREKPTLPYELIQNHLF